MADHPRRAFFGDEKQIGTPESSLISAGVSMYSTSLAA
jgi:hypothetical protein